VRLVLYSGKGGVGKTTTAAATAVRAAELGRRTLVISADLAHSLGDVFGRELGPEPCELAPKLDAVEIDARVEMARYWGSIREYLVELFRYQGIEEVLAEELALLPGAEELASLLALEAFGRRASYDLAVVDCAPTGSTLRLVTLPDMLGNALRMLPNLLRMLSAVVTPVARHLIAMPLPESAVFRDVQRLLNQHARALRRRLASSQTSVRLVVTPERAAIDEAHRAFTELSLFELSCDAVVMNRLLPDAAADEEFFSDWCHLQRDRRQEVARRFAPLEVIDAPLQEDEVVGLEALSAHARQLFGEREPDAVLSKAPRLRFYRGRRGYRVSVPLPGASIDELEVAAVDGELVIRAGARRRAIKLPPRFASLRIEAARLTGGKLVVSFTRGESDDADVDVVDTAMSRET
jgi:arsenite-transporting ATPase